MSELLLNIACFLGGIASGWLLWRNERVYLHGYRDGEREGRMEGFKAARRKISRGHLINPETLDWYNK